MGIKLTLTPQVNPDREIRLELNPSIESVVEESSDALQYTPTISKREVKTTVTVPDRSTVILSGLIREDTTRLTTKVPLLGDLPLIGYFFRSQKTVTNKSELVVLLSPHIDRGGPIPNAVALRYEALRADSLLSNGSAENGNDDESSAWR